jgi:ABC-2 type transport system ATP-binding protein
MNSPSVQVHGLTKKFGEFTAVDSVSFEVDRGEIFGFLGPNGAGKSTTIRMLCGILTPTSGTAEVLGYSAFTEKEKIRRSIGYMSQKFSLYDDLTPNENLSFFGTLYGLKGRSLSRRISEIIETSRLGNSAKVLTRELPAGLKQRLALGAATLHDPEILFLDEPTSGVDPATRQNFWSMIYEFARKGKTVFVTTHYMDEAEHCARIALIIAGKIIALDTPSSLKNEFKYDVYAVDADDFIGAYTRISKLPFVHEAALFGRSIHVHIDPTVQSRRDLEKKIRAFKGRSRKIGATLEDIFVTHAKEYKKYI